MFNTGIIPPYDKRGNRKDSGDLFVDLIEQTTVRHYPYQVKSLCVGKKNAPLSRKMAIERWHSASRGLAVFASRDRTRTDLRQAVNSILLSNLNNYCLYGCDKQQQEHEPGFMI